MKHLPLPRPNEDVESLFFSPWSQCLLRGSQCNKKLLRGPRRSHRVTQSFLEPPLNKCSSYSPLIQRGAGGEVFINSIKNQGPEPVKYNTKISIIVLVLGSVNY